MASERAEVIETPALTNRGFAAWTAALGAYQRYPELVGWGFEVAVPAKDLGAFTRRIAADPPGPLGPGNTITVIPPGSRPFYCLEELSSSRSAGVTSSFPEGTDICAGSTGRSVLSARDSGQSSYIPFSLNGQTLLALASPLYADGAAPSTVTARRAEFVGLTGILINPDTLTSDALAGHPSMAVTFSYADGGTHAAFKAGSEKPASMSWSTSLHNGWTVRTYAAAPSTAIGADGSALTVLVVGAIASFCVALLILVLSEGRLRALRLVEEKTAELRHQALHDSLTGLANRALITDRAQRILARSRRAGTVPCAMFLDLDGFKTVNDTLGHDVGDQLLKSVAARMHACLREADTIGRLGGDEFVILLDDIEVAQRAAEVAQRIIDVLSEPFDLVDGESPVTAGISIGIAVGARESAQELLRDADLALYDAKASGKNCFRTFDAAVNSGLERGLRKSVQEASSSSGR